MVPRINAPAIGGVFLSLNISGRQKDLLKNLEKNNSISLKKFLISYCCISNNALLNSKIAHKDIKFLLPDLKRFSYEYMLENLKDLYVGNIVLVEDCYGNFAPYLNPKIEEYDDIIIEYEEHQENDRFELAVELENLNLYELAELAKKYREDKRMTEYRKVCRIIKSKKDPSIEIYHKKKEKIILKGSDDNDKY